MSSMYYATIAYFIICLENYFLNLYMHFVNILINSIMFLFEYFSGLKKLIIQKRKICNEKDALNHEAHNCVLSDYSPLSP